MQEEFINDIITKLYNKISEDDLRAVRKELIITCNNYDINRKNTDLVVWNGVIPECVNVFLVSKHIEGKSSKTLKLYKMYIEDFFETVRLPIREINTNLIRGYLYNTKESRKISNRTLDSRRSALSSFFSWCAAEDYIDKNPMASIAPIKYTKTERNPLSDTELELVRQSCQTIREKALVEVFYSTGCRVTEVENMTIDNVDFNRNRIKVVGKGDKEREVYLSAKSKLLLQQYLETRSDNQNFLFVYDKKPFYNLKKSGLEKIVKQIGERAGIERLHPHLLRHTTATNCLRHGMDVTQVKEMLGHNSLDTTMIYAKVDKEEIYSKHSKCLN